VSLYLGAKSLDITGDISSAVRSLRLHYLKIPSLTWWPRRSLIQRLSLTMTVMDSDSLWIDCCTQTQ